MQHRNSVECDRLETRKPTEDSKRKGDEKEVVLYRRRIKMADTRPTNVQPIENRDLEHATHLRFYRNGDINFGGRSVTWNKKRIRTFDSFLDELTNSLKLRNGAVFRVYTPHHGHRVTNFDKLEEGGLYVAAGQEAFKPLGYTEIDPNPRKRNSKRNTDYYVEPVTHSKLRRSGKIKYIKSEGKIIKVWPNGDSVNPPRVILLTSWMQKDMDVIYDAIAERVSALLAGSVTRLYSLDGTRIKYTDQIHHGGQYVACAHQDKLRHVDYKDHGAKSIMTTPRLDSKYLPPLSRSTNKSTKSSKFSTPDHSNPTSSYASDKSSKSGYTTKYKSRQQTKKEDDGVFHAKPVAHKRGSQEKVKKVDYDKDEGGVFKAKGKNRSTSGAREVEETADTRTELPIDQREAETIEEDDDRNRSKNNNNSRTPRNNPPPQRPQKANSKSRTSNHSNQEQTTPRDNGKNSEEEAAIKIQSQFRGYQTRRQLTEEGVLNRPNGYVSRSPTPPTQPKTKPTRTNNIKTQPKPVTKATRHTPKSTQPTQEKKTADKTPPKNGPKKTSKTPDNKKETKSKKGNNDREVKAATTIQAGFRGYKTRKDLKKRQDTPIGSMSEELAATKIQAGFRGKKARSDMKKAKSELEDKVQKKYSEEEEKAATKIQAGFRGYKTRRDQLLKESEDFYTEQEHQAAAKIQSGYRGFRARKELALQRQSEYTENGTDSLEKYDEEHHKAAVKIQTGMRGVFARKELARLQAQKLYSNTEEQALSNYESI